MILLWLFSAFGPLLIWAIYTMVTFPGAASLIWTGLLHPTGCFDKRAQGATGQKQLEEWS